MAGDPYIPNGMGGCVAVPIQPADKSSDDGILARAIAMVGLAIDEVAVARKDVEVVADRWLGSRPETDNPATGGNPVADGQGHQLIGNIEDLHREIAALRGQITRLSAL